MIDLLSGFVPVCVCACLFPSGQFPSIIPIEFLPLFLFYNYILKKSQFLSIYNIPNKVYIGLCIAYAISLCIR